MLQGNGQDDGERVAELTEVGAILADAEEDLRGSVVVVEPDLDEELLAVDHQLLALGPPALRQVLA